MELILKHSPSVIMLDVHLPCDHDDDALQSGYDLVQALGQRAEMSGVPIFIITGMRQEACDKLLSQTILMPVELWSKPLDEELFLESLDRLTATTASR
jgi:CheY-like chemotaxis protein